MVSPILIRKGDATRFYWNIDANVGAGSPNRNDDVQLVQLAYAVMATKPDTPAGDKAICDGERIGVQLQRPERFRFRWNRVRFRLNRNARRGRC